MDKQRVIELNVPAKLKAMEAVKKKRRAEMRKWRKSRIMVFSNEQDFKEFLDEFNWHKRPVQKEIKFGFCYVTFLDWKPN